MLTADRFTIASDFDNIWNRPQRLTESGLGIYTCTYTADPLDCAKLSGLLPAAVLVIESGIISVSSQGGLRNLGIYDNRPAPFTETPVLYLSEPPEHQVTGMFQGVLFNRSYPLVSDITENHPYWNNAELADPLGITSRSMARSILASVSGSHRSRAISSGTVRRNRNDKGDDDPNRGKKPSVGTDAYEGWERFRDYGLRIAAGTSLGFLAFSGGMFLTRHDNTIHHIGYDLYAVSRRIRALENKIAKREHEDEIARRNK